MSGRRANVIDIREILRRVQLGESDRAIASVLRMSRKTVKKYRLWADQEGLLEGQLPANDVLHARLQSSMPETLPPLTESTVEPYRELIIHWRQRGLEAQAILQRLQDDHEFQGSYSAVWRFIRQLEPQLPEATVRIEVKPGEEAQVDFGYAGMMLDPALGKKRRCWVFVMTLSWSRHQYVEFVFDQKVATWLRLHVNAFNYFCAVPRRILLDNLKAGIIKACFEDPVVQRSYRELAEHYGFLVAPHRPRKPEHKGKVESGVHYVKRNLLASKDFADVHEANAGALEWIEKRAGQRIHGTTKEKPLVRFHEVEQAAMLSLPGEAYDLAVWKQLTVGRDCHVNFDKAYYSAPYKLRGQKIWVRGGLTSVGIYVEHRLKALHPRAKRPGERHTILSHLPPEKLAGLTTTRETCAARAVEIGPSTAEVVTRLLAERPVDRLPMVKRLLRLAEKYGELRLERACARALHFDDYKAGTIRRILEGGLDLAALPPLAVALEGDTQFARSLDELLPGLGGVSWN
jgi:transposase